MIPQQMKGKIQMKNPNLGRAGFVIGEQNRNLIFAWYLKNPCALQTECAKATGISKVAVNRATRAIRDGWRPRDPARAYSTAAWGVATLHLGSFSPIVGPLAGHIDDLVDESVKAVMEWQSIETCKDLEGGSSALIYLDGGVQITALWVQGRWQSRGEIIHPTHWMPLSKPPKAEVTP